jgi:hypothetical protein
MFLSLLFSLLSYRNNCVLDAYILSINIYIIFTHHGSLNISVRGVDKPEKVRTAIRLAASRIIALHYYGKITTNKTIKFYSH